MSIALDEELLALMTSRSSLPECAKSPGTTLYIFAECFNDEDWVNSNATMGDVRYEVG